MRDGFGRVLDERVFTDDIWRRVLREELNERQKGSTESQNQGLL